MPWQALIFFVMFDNYCYRQSFARSYFANVFVRIAFTKISLAKYRLFSKIWPVGTNPQSIFLKFKLRLFQALKKLIEVVLVQKVSKCIKKSVFSINQVTKF